VTLFKRHLFNFYFVSSKKDKGKMAATFKEPVFTVQDRANGVVPVTSSHAEPSSLGTCEDMSMYGVNDDGMSRYDALHGPSVYLQNELTAK